MSTKSCCSIWVQRNTLHLVVEANEDQQLRRQEQCSRAGLGLQGHPQPRCKQKRDWTVNLQWQPCWASQIFGDLFYTIFSTPCPLPLQLPPGTCISVVSKLLCFILVFFLLAVKLLLGLKRHRANHRYERDTLRREQINPLCRENSSFLECLFWKCHFNGSQNSWIKSHPYFHSKRNKDLLPSLTRKAVLTHR